MKRRWDDDVVFKNQARGSEKKDGQEFVNVRSLSHEVCGCRANVNDSGSATFRLSQEIHGMFNHSH